MANKVVFLKTAWMDYYDRRKGDKIIGRHQYVKKHGSGHEDRNFVLKGKYAHGYVPFFERLNLGEHFGVKQDAEFVDDATVIWIAKAPGSRGVVVVGWYKHARLYAQLQKTGDHLYLARALSSDCELIPSDERTYRISEAPVMTAVWYAPGRNKLKVDMEKLVAGKLEKPIPKKRIVTDLLRRAAIEKAAIEKVSTHFERKGFSIKSVERDYCGWDLTATKQSLELHLEVKGVSSSAIQADLSPNEYFAARTKRTTYRICIVTQALSGPTLHVFSYRPATKKWLDAPGKRQLGIARLLGARVSA